MAEISSKLDSEISRRQQITLDKVASKVHARRIMAGSFDAIAGMRRRLEYETRRILKVETQMRKLAAPYNTYVDLQREMADRQRRIRRLATLLGWGKKHFDARENDEHEEAIVKSFDNLPTETEMREKLPLWQAMAEYLSHVAKAKLGEMEQFLTEVGFEGVSRQSLESAIRKHARTFKVEKTRHEKYVSLAVK